MAYVQQQQQQPSSGFGGGYQYGNTDSGANYGGHVFASPPPQPPAPGPVSAGSGPYNSGSGGAAPYFGSSGGDGYSNSNAAGDMMWRMGLNYGQTLLQQGLEHGEQGARKYVPYWTRLRGLFAVDNQYVKKKLGILLFPFTRRYAAAAGGAMAASYGRSDDQVFSSPTGVTAPGFSAPSAASTTMILPTQDTFAPDLYIPLMAVVTYLLLSALLYGVTMQSPVTMAVLASTLSAVALWQVLEVLVGKALAYFLHVVTGAPLLDVIALSGYKYVLVCLVIILQRLGHSLGHSRLSTGVLLLYAVAAHVTFTVNSIRRGNARDDGRVPPRAQLLAYTLAATQVPGMLWMSLRPLMFANGSASSMSKI